MSFVDFKEVANPVAGTGTKYGSQDLLDIMQIFNGKTVSNRRPHIINQWRWDNGFDVKEITGPSTTPASGYQTFFIDSADHHIKRKDNTGAVIDIETSSTSGYRDFPRIATPANPATNTARLYSKQIDTNNDGLFMLIKKAGSFVEVQLA